MIYDTGQSLITKEKWGEFIWYSPTLNAKALREKWLKGQKINCDILYEVYLMEHCLRAKQDRFFSILMR